MHIDSYLAAAKIYLDDQDDVDAYLAAQEAYFSARMSSCRRDIYADEVLRKRIDFYRQKLGRTGLIFPVSFSELAPLPEVRVMDILQSFGESTPPDADENRQLLGETALTMAKVIADQIIPKVPDLKAL